MTSVSVNIDNKNYRIACEIGQENYINELANKLNDNMATIRQEFAGLSHQQITIMSAMQNLDKIENLNEQLKLLEDSLSLLEQSQRLKNNDDMAIVNMLINSAKEIEKTTNVILQNQ